jgi:membrane associated rhomboid family serine protease
MSYQQYRPGGFQILPTVVKNLLIINGIMYLATWVFQGKFNLDLSSYLGLHFLTSPEFRPYQFVSYMFMHGSLMHIFFNMFALWTFGAALENVWGPKRFFIFYMVCGIGAGFIQTAVVGWDIHQTQQAINVFYDSMAPDDFRLFLKEKGFLASNDDGFLMRIYNYVFGHKSNQNLLDFIDEWSADKSNQSYAIEAKMFCDGYLNAKINSVTVGASGAVYGVLLAFGMMFPNALLYLYFAIPIKAKYAVLLFGVLELWMGLKNSGSDNVAHFAHLGGMLFGYFLIIAWKKKQFRQDDF